MFQVVLFLVVLQNGQERKTCSRKDSSHRRNQLWFRLCLVWRFLGSQNHSPSKLLQAILWHAFVCTKPGSISVPQCSETLKPQEKKASSLQKLRKIQSQENRIFLQEPKQLENVSIQMFKVRPLSLFNYKINILGLDFVFTLQNYSWNPGKRKNVFLCHTGTIQASPQTKRFYKNTEVSGTN